MALDRWSLRLRIFLFFGLQGLGSLALVLAGLVLGGLRGGSVHEAVTLAGIVAGFGILALTAGIWLLFDEHLAKPIEALAASLRATAHVGADAPTHDARYLGDLAPAAQALGAALSDQTLTSAAQVSAETARLSDEAALLTALLSKIPVAVILANARDEIVLYDGQAAEALAQVAPPRLNAPLGDYFAAAELAQAKNKLARTELTRSPQEVRTRLQGLGVAASFDARLIPMAQGGVLILIDPEDTPLPATAPRPMVYDFALLDRRPPDCVEATALRDLSFAVFDTETTGLLPHRDDIVQLGALRVVNGRIVPGEALDLLVDPSRAIPATASAVHGITDAMVAGAPDIRQVSRSFHAFARGAVIVAHNAPFDMAFLHRHAAQAEVQWDHPILDTVLLSAVLFGASQPHTLDAICTRLGIAIPEALRHTALGDAQATAEALVRMIPMLEARGMTTLGEVLSETRRHGRLLEDMNEGRPKRLGGPIESLSRA